MGIKEFEDSIIYRINLTQKEIKQYLQELQCQKDTGSGKLDELIARLKKLLEKGGW